VSSPLKLINGLKPTNESKHCALKLEFYGRSLSVPLDTNAVALGGQQVRRALDMSGFIGGFQGGCNYQAGVWVIGVEGDGSAFNKEGQNFETALANFPGLATRTNWISQTQERWLVTARGRLGLSGWGWFGDKTLVYVTGGGAWAKIDTSEFLIGTNSSSPANGHQESNTRSGWTVGAGYEYALGYGWSVRGEYLYVKFDDFTTLTNGPFNRNNVTSHQVRLEDFIWRAGMNYKFNWGY